jgi:glycosyltransferase involved in cell wall biosynthesis
MLHLSVVIAAHNASATIRPCLAALVDQVDRHNGEVIVADSSTDGTDAIVREGFPRVRLLHFAESLALPHLRARGIAAACGEIIAILDPYALAGPGWAAALLLAHEQQPNLVIGGTVELYQAGDQGLLTWATYINEYGMFMPPLPPGSMEILPGSNISYKREALFEGDRPRYTEFWKTFANEEVVAAGAPLWQAPDMNVLLWKPIPFGDFLRTRYDHGRCFAGMRTAHAPVAERVARMLSAPLLPLAFLWRWGRRYWVKGRGRSRFVLTLPLQILLFGNWARGEFMGYLRGPGQCCEKLFY